MRVRVFYTGSTTKPDQYVVVAEGSTVRQALSAGGVPTEGVSVRVDRRDADLDTVVGAEAQIVVTAKNLKGAADEVDPLAAIKMTVDQVINWGKGDVKLGSGVVGKALAKQAESAQEALLEVVQELIEDAKPVSAANNRRIDALEKELAEAKDNQKRFTYSLQQLIEKENPFALLGVMGQKYRAEELCDTIGCELPDVKSPLWKTSAED